MNKKYQKQQSDKGDKQAFYKKKFFPFIPPATAILIILVYIAFSSSAKKSQSKCFKEDFAICAAEFGDEYLRMKVAYSPPVKAQGLMGVTEMGTDEGMIFVYDYPQVLSFWMKETLMPLSIAFLDSAGIVLSVQEMETQPNATDDKLKIYDSPASAMYAVEANKNWFTEHGVKVGDKIVLPSKLVTDLIGDIE